MKFHRRYLKEKKSIVINSPKKLNDPLTSPKAHWLILKIFYSDTKIPLIIPLIIENKEITNFREKANSFNNFLLPCVHPL